MSSLFNARVLADAQAVLGDTDAWDGPTWERAAITLASAVISAEMRTTGASLDNLLPHVVCECGGTGEVAVTPGQPGDGPMPCPTCSPGMTDLMVTPESIDAFLAEASTAGSLGTNKARRGGVETNV